MAEHRAIGGRSRRVDAFAKVVGQARYADDYTAPGMLHAVALRSDRPHAELISIDTETAASMPEVAAVLTASDIPGEVGIGGVVPHTRVLADDRVRYVGDGVAVVAAETRRQACDARDAISVAYRDLPTVFDPAEALEPSAPLVHPEGNLCAEHVVRRGNADAALASADIVVSMDFRTPRVSHAYLEPESVLAIPEGDGVRVIGSIQNVYTTHRHLARVLNLPRNRVRIQQAVIGGSFGGKDDVMTVLSARAALCAMATGRPVKMTNTREESFLEGYKRHPYVMSYTVGADSDGTLTALVADILADAGAYCSMSPFVTWRSAVQATGPYRVPNVDVRVRAAYTNRTYTGAMRGFGSPQINIAIEGIMDELAARCGIDPLQFRLKNGFVDGDTTATGQRLPGRVSLHDVLNAAANKIDWSTDTTEQSGRVRAKGIACAYRGVLLGAEGTDVASATVTILPDCGVVVASGITDMGQGTATSLSLIAAEVLGIDPSRVRFLETDALRDEDCGPTVASRGTIMGGQAVRIASETLRDRLLDLAADSCNTERNGLCLTSTGALSGRSVIATFEELVDRAVKQGISLSAQGWHRSPDTSWDEKGGKGNAYFTFVYGAVAAEVEVDVETGAVDVLKVAAAHDVGRSVHTSGCEGQVYGGVAMGQGYALLEEFVIEDGRPTTHNFDTYLIPTADDVSTVDVTLVENPDDAGPFGAKSLGEPALETVAPAILNAIARATGRRITEPPADLERVLLGRKLVRIGPRGSEKATEL